MRCWTLPVEMSSQSVSARWNTRISDHNTGAPIRELMAQFAPRKPRVTKLRPMVQPSFAIQHEHNLAWQCDHIQRFKPFRRLEPSAIVASSRSRHHEAGSSTPAARNA